MRELCGLNIRQNRGIVGDDIHKIESGIIADWYKNANQVAPLELSPYLYSLTGHPSPEIVIGKNSGLPTIDIKLKELDMDPIADKDVKLDILARIKEKSFRKSGLLDNDEFRQIVSQVIGK